MEEIILFTDELKLFFKELGFFITKKLHLSLLRFEEGKGVFVTALYKTKKNLLKFYTYT